MKNLISTRIPSVCICFTVIILLDVLGSNPINPGILGLFLWLIVCQAIDALVSRIDFRKWSRYCLTESAILYIASLILYPFISGGTALTPYRLFKFSIVFLITDVFIFYYFHKKHLLQADEINELIDEKNEKKSKPPQQADGAASL